MAHQKFDMRKLERLNDEGRFDTLKPDVMWQALGLVEPEVIVEIGAGTGLFAATFAALAPGAVVYAVDTEPVMTDWMRENRPEVARGAIVPVGSTETAVPLPDGIADAVVMINVHHELAEPRAIYAEAFRLLRKGGRVLVVDWARRETPKGPSQEVRVSATVVRELLRRAGFEDLLAQEDALPWHFVVTGTR